jgi:hypothetical protein
VNKICTINDTAQLHRKITSWNEEEVLVNVTAIDDTSGFVQFYCAFETGQSCCEVFGSEILLNDKEVSIKDLIALRLWNTNLFVEKIKISNLEDLDDYNCNGNCSGKVIVEVILDKDNILKFIFFNEHNGYYAHRIAWEELEKDKNLEVRVLTDNIDI